MQGVSYTQITTTTQRRAATTTKTTDWYSVLHRLVS